MNTLHFCIIMKKMNNSSFLSLKKLQIYVITILKKCNREEVCTLEEKFMINYWSGKISIQIGMQ